MDFCFFFNVLAIVSGPDAHKRAETNVFLSSKLRRNQTRRVVILPRDHNRLLVFFFFLFFPSAVALRGAYPAGVDARTR